MKLIFKTNANNPSKIYQKTHPPKDPRLEAALQSGDLQKVRAAVARRDTGDTGSEKATTPWTRWVAAAYYLNKEWKATAGGERGSSALALKSLSLGEACLIS